MTKNGIDAPEVKNFAAKLVEWAGVVRETFKQGGIDEIITTRRLIHILNFYMYGKQNKMTAIEYCISRFEDETKASLRSLYQKIDESVAVGPTPTPDPTPSTDEVPF